MTRALVVTRYLPSGDPTRVHGVFGRLDMLLSAVTQSVDDVHCLVLLPAGDPISARELGEHQQRLRQRSSSNLTLSLAPVVSVDFSGSSRWNLVRGIFNHAALGLVGPYFSDRVAAVVGETLKTPVDFILAHRLECMCALIRGMPKSCRAPLFFDLDDVEHVSFGRRLLFSPGYANERLQLFHWPNLMLTEIRAIRRATETFVCSEKDMRYLRRISRNANISVVPNSVIVGQPLSPAASPTMLFVGSFTFRPNVEAAELMLRTVWPTVREHVPDARLLIVGNWPERISGFSETQEGVTFTGFVDDLKPIYESARLVCCPIRYGSGTRVKIIEAAAYGRAVVSTAVGAEGLEFEHGTEIIVESDISRMAEKCVGLLKSPARCIDIGLKANAKARQLYGRTEVTARVAKRMIDAIESAGEVYSVS